MKLDAKAVQIIVSAIDAGACCNSGSMSPAVNGTKNAF
jgi:hypothetical protein